MSSALQASPTKSLSKIPDFRKPAYSRLAPVWAIKAQPFGLSERNPTMKASPLSIQGEELGVRVLRMPVPTSPFHVLKASIPVQTYPSAVQWLLITIFHGLRRFRVWVNESIYSRLTHGYSKFYPFGVLIEQSKYSSPQWVSSLTAFITSLFETCPTFRWIHHWIFDIQNSSFSISNFPF